MHLGPVLDTFPSTIFFPLDHGGFAIPHEIVRDWNIGVLWCVLRIDTNARSSIWTLQPYDEILPLSLATKDLVQNSAGSLSGSLGSHGACP